ncbi:MAG: di-trans,poly-cis-decaprenylcistransferase [Bacilli bacterium]|nr:di-trans,poly-cis-decaprenylcistransferase [Bacilli bacterium]
MPKKKTFVLTKKLQHVAFIMDGNGRWANLRGLPRHLGHREAMNRIMEIFETCREFNIYCMSFYAFSTENWNRPQDEIDHLMDYLEEWFAKEIDYLDSVGARLQISGDIARLRDSTRNACIAAYERTKNNNAIVVNVCLNYGGRDDIVRACRAIAQEAKEGKVDIDAIDEPYFGEHLYTHGLPDVDLMIRTSGEQRLSNYLLWQNAYAEFVFTPVKWPDFKRKAFIDCLEEFQNRNRRYGGLKNE